MQLIRKTILISEDHTLKLDVSVPHEIPAGPAEVIVSISPPAILSRKEALLSHVGSLVGVWENKKDSVALQRELRDEWE